MRENVELIHIVIADRHAVVRRGLRLVLDQQLDFQVVGEAGTAAETLQHALDSQPRLVIFDLPLPADQWRSFFHTLHEMCPSVRILVLTDEQQRLPVSLPPSMVHGHLFKSISPSALANAVRIIARGGTKYDPILTRTPDSIASGMDEISPPDLTERELDVLQLIPVLATNREIALALGVSEETIRSHVKSILRKLRSRSRTQATVQALRLNILNLEELGVPHTRPRNVRPDLIQRST